MAEPGQETAAPALQLLPGGAGRRQIPQNKEAEESVVGGLLFSGKAIRWVSEIINPEDFYSPPLRAIYETMLALDSEGSAIDLITVNEALRQSGAMAKLRPLGSEVYLAQLANQVGTVENITYHARIIRDKARARTVIEAGAALTEKGYGNDAASSAAAAGLQLLEISRQGDWPEPMPLASTLLPVPSLPETLLPEALRPWLSDVSERAQCPLEYAAVGAVIGAAALIGRQIAVRPKTQDSWREYGNLWGLVIGPPGVKKSPALKEALGPIYAIQREAWQAHKEAVQSAEMKDVTRKVKEKEVKRRIEEAVTRAASGLTGLNPNLCDSVEELEEELHSLQPPRLNARRYLTSDATVEKLVELLQENPNGLLVHRDEMRGLLTGWDRDGHEGDRAFFLEGWNGDGAYTSDRIGRGTNHVEGMCISLVGTIQPGPLALYIRKAAEGGDDDGLLQRLQLAVYPDISKQYIDINRQPDPVAKGRVYSLYKRLTTLYPSEVGAEMGGDGIPYMGFDTAADEFAAGFRVALNRRIRQGDELGSLRAHLAKFDKLFNALALVFHLLDCVDTGNGGRIPLSIAVKAAEWCNFLEAHARRIYWLGLCQDDPPANMLAAKIQAGKLGERFTAREVYIHRWSGLLDRSAVEAAAKELVEMGWLRPTLAGGGRGPRTTAYLINPRLKKGKNDQVLVSQ